MRIQNLIDWYMDNQTSMSALESEIGFNALAQIISKVNRWDFADSYEWLTYQL